MYFRRLLVDIFGFFSLFLVIGILFFDKNTNNTLFVIITLAIIMIFFYFVITYHIKVVTGDWIDTLDYSLVNVEQIQIPMKDNWSICGIIIKAKNQLSSKPSPGVIIHHGVSAKKEHFGVFGIPLALHGYTILLVDARAHGESRKHNRKARRDDWYIDQEIGIFPDFSQIVDFFSQRPDVDPSRIACIGHSMGGTICLSRGLLDPRIQLCIGISPLYNFANVLASLQANSIFSEEWWMIQSLKFVVNFTKLLAVQDHFSPQKAILNIDQGEAVKKARLIHCKDDKLVLFEYHGKKIIEALNLPEHAYFLTSKGDHSYRGQETVIIERLLTWLNEKFGGISNV